LVLENKCVRLVGAREFRAVDAAERTEDAFQEGDVRGSPVRAYVIDLGVVAVIADVGGVNRAEAQSALEPVLAHLAEGRIGARGRPGERGAGEMRNDRRRTDKSQRMTTRNEKHVFPPKVFLMGETMPRFPPACE